MSLTIPFDPTGIPPRIADELELIVTNLQAWVNRGVQDFTSYGTFVQPRCRYFLPAAQSVPNSTDTIVVFEPYGKEFPATTQLFEVHYDNGAQFGRLFLQGDQDYFVPPVAGQYLIVAGTSFVANATGYRDLWIEIEQHAAAGTNVTFQMPGVNMPVNSASISTRLQVFTPVTVIDPAVGETRIRLKVYQNSGGSLNIQQGFAGTYFHAEKIS